MPAEREEHEEISAGSSLSEGPRTRLRPIEPDACRIILYFSFAGQRTPAWITGFKCESFSHVRKKIPGPCFKMSRAGNPPARTWFYLDVRSLKSIAYSLSLQSLVSACQKAIPRRARPVGEKTCIKRVLRHQSNVIGTKAHGCASANLRMPA